MNKLLVRMAHICRAIAKGNYDFLEQLEQLTIKDRHPQEIADLAESFSLMLVKLQAREYELEQAREKLTEQNAHLKDKVHTLKIDIDHMKKASAVAQVTQSEFFKKILQKTKRRRKK